MYLLPFVNCFLVTFVFSSVLGFFFRICFFVFFFENFIGEWGEQAARCGLEPSVDKAEKASFHVPWGKGAKTWRFGLGSYPSTTPP